MARRLQLYTPLEFNLITKKMSHSVPDNFFSKKSSNKTLKTVLDDAKFKKLYDVNFMHKFQIHYIPVENEHTLFISSRFVNNLNFSLYSYLPSKIFKDLSLSVNERIGNPVLLFSTINPLQLMTDTVTGKYKIKMSYPSLRSCGFLTNKNDLSQINHFEKIPLILPHKDCFVYKDGNVIKGFAFPPDIKYPFWVFFVDSKQNIVAFFPLYVNGVIQHMKCLIYEQLFEYFSNRLTHIILNNELNNVDKKKFLKNFNLPINYKNLPQIIEKFYLYLAKNFSHKQVDLYRQETPNPFSKNVAVNQNLILSSFSNSVTFLPLDYDFNDLNNLITKFEIVEGIKITKRAKIVDDKIINLPDNYLWISYSQDFFCKGKILLGKWFVTKDFININNVKFYCLQFKHENHLNDFKYESNRRLEHYATRYIITDAKTAPYNTVIHGKLENHETFVIVTDQINNRRVIVNILHCYNICNNFKNNFDNSKYKTLPLNDINIDKEFILNNASLFIKNDKGLNVFVAELMGGEWIIDDDFTGKNQVFYQLFNGNFVSNITDKKELQVSEFFIIINPGAIVYIARRLRDTETLYLKYFDNYITDIIHSNLKD